MATVKLYHIVWLAGWLVGSLVGWLDGLSISVHTRKHILCSANSPRTSNSNINRWSQQTSSSTISYIGGIAFPIFISLFGQIHIWECNTTTNIYASFLAFHCNTYFNFFFFLLCLERSGSADSITRYNHTLMNMFSSQLVMCLIHIHE